MVAGRITSGRTRNRPLKCQSNGCNENVAFGEECRVSERYKHKVRRKEEECLVRDHPPKIKSSCGSCKTGLDD